MKKNEHLCTRDSIKISLNLASQSFLFLSKCLRTDTAFLIKQYRSSGISEESPVKKKKHTDRKKIEKKSTNSRVLTQDNMIHVVELVNKTRIYLYPLNPLSSSPRYDVTTTDAAYYYVSLIG